MKKEQKSFQNYYRFCISVVCVIGLLWNCLISACAAESIETEILYVTMKDDNTYMVSRYEDIQAGAITDAKVQNGAIVISGDVKKVGTSAFAGCTRVKSISFGTSVKTIGEKTFARDTKLKKITIKGKKLKSIGKNSFLGVPKTIEIRAPKSKVKAYTKMINKA
ncbi:MAG: leucine-rich repeat protein [Lachnospiraceae bacterium]